MNQVSVIIENIKKYWWIALSLAIVVLYFMYQRRGRRIGELTYDVLKERLGHKVEAVREKLKAQEKDYEEANKKYQEFKRVHNGLFNSLDIYVPKDV